MKRRGLQLIVRDMQTGEEVGEVRIPAVWWDAPRDDFDRQWLDILTTLREYAEAV